jgi:glycosyltransferase involved in cell wall biosynthesis
MALGIPVVGTRIGGTVEQLEDGVSGLLVEPNDDTGLATALDALLSDDGLRERLSRAARERLESRFSFPIMRDRITGIYEACLRGRRLCETAA